MVTLARREEHRHGYDWICWYRRQANGSRCQLHNPESDPSRAWQLRFPGPYPILDAREARKAKDLALMARASDGFGCIGIPLALRSVRGISGMFHVKRRNGLRGTGDLLRSVCRSNPIPDGDAIAHQCAPIAPRRTHELRYLSLRRSTRRRLVEQSKGTGASRAPGLGHQQQPLDPSSAAWAHFGAQEAVRTPERQEHPLRPQQQQRQPCRKSTPQGEATRSNWCQ